MITMLTNTWAQFELPQSESGITELDMGCGKGKFTLALARRYPERLVLGNDVMLGRLRRLDRKVERGGLSNLRLRKYRTISVPTMTRFRT